MDRKNFEGRIDVDSTIGKINKLQGLYRGGQISRRQFVEGGLTAGLTIAAALAFVSDVEAAMPKKGGNLKCGLAHGSISACGIIN